MPADRQVKIKMDDIKSKNSLFASRLILIGFVVPTLTLISFGLTCYMLWNILRYFYSPNNIPFMWGYHLDALMTFFGIIIFFIGIIHSIVNNRTLNIILIFLATFALIGLQTTTFFYVPYRTILMTCTFLFCICIKIKLNSIILGYLYKNKINEATENT